MTGETYPADQLPALLGGQKQRRSKYGNEPCEYDGYRFDSKAEMERYKELILLRDTGFIDDIQVHPHWDLHIVGDIKLARYTADFSYQVVFDGQSRLQVEDVKSPQTRKTTDYRLRKAWMKLEYGIDVREIL